MRPGGPVRLHNWEKVIPAPWSYHQGVSPVYRCAECGSIVGTGGRDSYVFPCPGRQAQS